MYVKKMRKCDLYLGKKKSHQMKVTLRSPRWLKLTENGIKSSVINMTKSFKNYV